MKEVLELINNRRQVLKEINKLDEIVYNNLSSYLSKDELDNYVSEKILPIVLSYNDCESDLLKCESLDSLTESFIISMKKKLDVAYSLLVERQNILSNSSSMSSFTHKLTHEQRKKSKQLSV